MCRFFSREVFTVLSASEYFKWRGKLEVLCCTCLAIRMISEPVKTLSTSPGGGEKRREDGQTHLAHTPMVYVVSKRDSTTV